VVCSKAVDSESDSLNRRVVCSKAVDSESDSLAGQEARRVVCLKACVV
jgi:hypothetical protein